MSSKFKFQIVNIFEKLVNFKYVET